MNKYTYEELIILLNKTEKERDEALKDTGEETDFTMKDSYGNITKGKFIKPYTQIVEELRNEIILLKEKLRIWDTI